MAEDTVDSGPDRTGAPTPVPLALACKLATAVAAVRTVRRNGINEAQRYKYAMESDILTEAKRVLGEAKVITVVDLKSVSIPRSIPRRDGSGMAIYRVWLAVTFIDTEGGEHWTTYGCGEAMDAGDKAIYKAITGALKYVLTKVLLIPTGDDPEREQRDEREDRRRRAPAAGTSAPVEPGQLHLATPQATRANGFITEQENTRFWAASRRDGAHGADEVRTWLGTLGYESSKHIPSTEFARLLARVSDRTPLTEEPAGDHRGG